MKLNFYSMYDKAVGAYMRPFVMQSDGQAVRQFTDEAVNAESPISKHPEDYSLFRIGMFDDAKGEIIHEDPTCLARAHEVIALSQVVDREGIERYGREIMPQGNGVDVRSDV